MDENGNGRKTTIRNSTFEIFLLNMRQSNRAYLHVRCENDDISVQNSQFHNHKRHSFVLCEAFGLFLDDVQVNGNGADKHKQRRLVHFVWH